MFFLNLNPRIVNDLEELRNLLAKGSVSIPLSLSPQCGGIRSFGGDQDVAVFTEDELELKFIEALSRSPVSQLMVYNLLE